MPIPLQISFRDMDSTPALEAAIRERADKLALFSNRITACEVVVDRPHQHHHRGQHVRVSIKLHVPGADLVVNRDSDQDGSHEDAYVAIRDAFLAVRRQLEDHVERQREPA